jgi:hypothetical protein
MSSQGSSENNFWLDCQIQKQEADKLLKERRYRDALERYRESNDCFENSIHYTQPPRTKKSITMINDFIQEIQNRVKVIERILVSTNKRSIKNEYPLDQLKIFSEKDWLNLSLFDFIRISNAYNIPLSEDENNIENMKYKFFIDFTEKYNKFRLNLQSYDKAQLEKLNWIAWNAYNIIELRNIANFFSIPFQKSGNKDELIDILYEYFQNSKKKSSKILSKKELEVLDQDVWKSFTIQELNQIVELYKIKIDKNLNKEKLSKFLYHHFQKQKGWSSSLLSYFS